MQIIVDLNALEDGNGTECSPLQSLNSAFQLASPNATIFLLPSVLPAISSASITIHSVLTVSGQQNVVILANQITISQTGSLTLRNVTLQTQTQNPLFDTSGVFILEQIRIESLGESLVELRLGEVILRNGNVVNQTAPFCVFHQDNAILTLVFTNFTIMKSDLIQILNYQQGGNSTITITSCTVNHIEGYLLNLKGTPLSLLQIRLESVSIQTSTVPILEGDLSNIALTVNNSIFLDMSRIVIGNLIDSTFLFDQCQFSQFSSSLFTFPQLKGSVTILRSTISNIASGPIISVPNNPYPFQSAKVAFSDCNITNITNTNSRIVSGIFCGTSASLALSHLNVSRLSLYAGGLFKIIGGMASVSEITYTNSSSFIYGTYEIFQSTFMISKVVITQIESKLYAMTPMVGSTGFLDQIVIVDTKTSYNPEGFSGLVLFWSGASSKVSLTNSYFRNSGFTAESLVVTDYATLTVSNLTFVDSIYQTLFAAFDGGYLEANGVTHIRAKAVSVMSCVLSNPCCSLANMVFLETIDLTYFITSLNSNAIIKDSNFIQADYHFANVINGQIAISNVTFSNSKITICNNCYYSTLSINSLRIFQIESKWLFQVTSTNVNIVNSVFTEIQLDILVEAVSSNITLDNCEISNVMTNSYGGIISAATNSVVIISNSNVSNVLGKLSIKIGLIYVFASHLLIQHSLFAKLNSTLVYSVKSRVDIDESSFTNGGLYSATPNKVVKTLGGVLWSEDSSQLSIKNSQFLSNSADFGGVLYLIHKAISGVLYYVTNCRFEDNGVIQSGGVIYSSNVNISVTNSYFVDNSAQKGGALYLINTFLSISHSELINNTAQLDGGGIDFLTSQFAISNVTFLNNSAIYGPDFAGSGLTLAVIQADSLPLYNFSIESASGQLFNSTFSIAIFDGFGQIMRTDNTTQVTFSSPDRNVSLLGISTIQCHMGTFIVSKLGVFGVPGSNITIIGTTSQLSNFLFTVNLRNCVAGEYEDNSECKQCLRNTYSLLFGKPCIACPMGAQCPGGSLLILEKGYWRSSTDSDHIMSCIVPELCIGGFDSRCEVGQSGKLCLECDPGYYKLNQLQCLPCSSLSVSVLKSALSTLLGLGSIVVASRSPGAILVHALIFDYFHTLRSLANFVIYWPNAIGFLYSVLGDIGSLGLSAFTDLCLGRVAGTQTAFSQLSVSALYIGVLLSLSLTAGMITRRYLKPKFHLVLTISAYWLYCILPMMYLRALQMFAWIIIEDHILLLSDPQVEYWSDAHQLFTFTFAFPLLILGVVLLLLLVCIRVKSLHLFDLSPDQISFLIILLFRNYYLTSLLLFSNAFVIYTQVGLIILLNSAVEFLLRYVRVPGTLSPLYHSCLISSTVLSFCCALYSAGQSSQRDKEYLFIFASYISICLPLLYGLLKCPRMKPHIYVTVSPESQSISEIEMPEAPNQSKASNLQEDSS